MSICCFVLCFLLLPFWSVAYELAQAFILIILSYGAKHTECSIGTDIKFADKSAATSKNSKKRFSTGCVATKCIVPHT